MTDLAAQVGSSDRDYAVGLISRVCQLAGSPSYVSDLRAGLRGAGVLQAVEHHDTAALFDWLLSMMSYQGIANRIAEDYLLEHGSVQYRQIEQLLAQRPSCPKLKGHWLFESCLYRKASQTCAEPYHFPACPLPSHNLRNGRLNQTAYSLFLFLRDVAGGDLVAWIDQQLETVRASQPTDAVAAMRDALVEPMRSIYGISHKVIVMALASLLLGAGRHKPLWLQLGPRLIVVDTLVHNFLQRTGILQRSAAEHAYGLGCYRSGGCADILQAVARQIDASRFHPSFPRVFPRFVQHAIWRYCANDGLDVCNGNRIDDSSPCQNRHCRLYERCDRVSLRNGQNRASAVSV